MTQERHDRSWPVLKDLKDTKPKSLILMILAILCGLVASYLTSRIIAEKQETVRALMAKQDFSAGTLIKQPEVMFEIKELPITGPARHFIPGDLESIKRLRKRVLVRALNEGDLLINSDLISEEQERLLLIAGVPDMIERFEELAKQDIVPEEYRQRLVAMAAHVDSLERQVNLFRWLMALILVSGFIVFLNIVRTAQLGMLERYDGLLKWSAVVQGVAVAVLLVVAVLQPPRAAVNAVSDVTVGVLWGVLLILIVIESLRMMLDRGPASSIE